MPEPRAEFLLYEMAAALRLVDRELELFRDTAQLHGCAGLPEADTPHPVDEDASGMTSAASGMLAELGEVRRMLQSLSTDRAEHPADTP